MLFSHIRRSVIHFGFLLIACSALHGTSFAADYIGKFEPVLVPNVEDFERVVFKSISPDQVKGLADIPAGSHLTAARLMDPKTQKYTVLALLIESGDKDPVMFVDLDGDNTLKETEKFELKQGKPDNPFLWEATAGLKLTEGTFTTCPIFLRYFKRVRTEKMGPNDRLVTQSTEVMAKGTVDVQGKLILVQYAYDPGSKKIDPKSGLLGVDSDRDGIVDIGAMSPESTKANDESPVFRVGNLYVSTKKADASKNQIVLRDHEAKDYKRAEIYIDKEFPEFNFTDFSGKKRKFSEFRGKYVLLDIWGFWCPPCRTELPYLREAHRRFAARNLVIVGLNTDEQYTVDSMKKGLNEAGMTWTNAQFESVVDFLRVNLRVNSYPTTFLISPEGKVMSISRTNRGEPSLRGEDLLESLDKALPTL